MKKILIVDDEKLVRWSLKEALFQEDYLVEAVPLVEEALKLVKKESYDLLITDLKLPGLGGIDLIKELKKLSPRTKVIVLTAYGSRETKEEAEDLGIDLFLDKPFNTEDIKKFIKEELLRNMCQIVQ